MSTPTRVRNPEELAEARRAAGRLRARWLLALEKGQATPYELLEAATREGGRPLQALRVRQVLSHVPGWSRTSVDAVMHDLREATGVGADVPDRDLNVRWLVLARRVDEGSRLTALSTAMVRQRGDLGQPGRVSGFPYGPLREGRQT